MNKILKDTLILTIITVVAGFCLGFVYDITKDPIAATQELAKQNAYKAVFTDADLFKEDEALSLDNVESKLSEGGFNAVSIDEALVALDSTGNVIGYVLTVTDSEGYGGDIKIAMGIKSDGTLNGIEILSISETAGLGMRADTDEFKGQFSNKHVEQFVYTKTGAQNDYEIDALSGATITTKAVLNAVNGGLYYIKTVVGGVANG